MSVYWNACLSLPDTSCLCELFYVWLAGDCGLPQTAMGGHVLNARQHFRGQPFPQRRSQCWCTLKVIRDRAGSSSNELRVVSVRTWLYSTLVCNKYTAVFYATKLQLTPPRSLLQCTRYAQPICNDNRSFFVYSLIMSISCYDLA